METKHWLAAPGDLRNLAGLPPMSRLAGLDPGRRRIGLALSDNAKRQALAHGVLTRSKLAADLAALAGFAAEWRVAGFVLGLPLTMGGHEGRQAQAARSFARHLAQHSSLPLAFEDERLSTIGAEKRLAELPRPGWVKREALDAEAAAAILQTALDRLKQSPALPALAPDTPLMR